MREIYNIIIAEYGYLIKGITTVLTILVPTLTYLLYRKKTKQDLKNDALKEIRFSIYLEESYRLNLDKNNVFILFNVSLTNHSISRKYVKPTLKIEYSNHTIRLKHNYNLFNEIPHKELTHLESIVELNENEIKIGWLIFKYPPELYNKLIDNYSIRIEDNNKQVAETSTVLIKEVYYAKSSQK